MTKNTNTENNTEFDAQSAFAYLSDDGMGGFESLNSDVVAFPFIRVLQSISPQCKRTKPEYVEGAEEGMLFNNINKRLIEPPTDIVVGRFDRYYIEWKPNRGGFVAAHLPEEVEAGLRSGKLIRNEKNRVIDRATGNEYSDTYAYYIVFTDYPEDGVCLLCLSSTQLKEARRWNRLLMSTYLPGTGRRALPYHMRWTVTTPTMSNDQGDWSGFKVDFAGFVTPEQLTLVTEERKALPAPDTSRPDFKALESGSYDDDVVDTSVAY